MKIESYLKHSPVFKLLEFALHLEYKINETIAESTLSYYQALVLVSLYTEERQDVTLKELSEVFPMTKSGLSQTLSLLESKQLLKRKTHSDKRAYLFQVTATGESLALRLMAQLETLEQTYENEELFKTLMKSRALA